MGTELQKIIYSESLNRDMTSFGADRLAKDMFRFFNNVTLGTRSLISHELMMGPKIVDAETCENFMEWLWQNAGRQDLTMDNYEEFTTLLESAKPKFREWFERNAGMEDLSGGNFEEFKTLLASPKFRLLSYYFYIRLVGAVRPTYEADHISLKSSDKVVLQMSKMVAMSQSEVLKDMLDHTDGKGDIPVPGVPYDLLSRITSFCKKKHKYLSVADKMDVAKLHDSDDKKEEEAVLPGFKLHPTDEELVAFYLRRQVEKKPHLVERIKENIDIYKYDPWNHLNYAFQENSISLKSSDNMVLKMNKRAATSQSKVLRDVVDSTGGLDEIPVPGVTGLILSKITPFCKKIHKFDTQLNIITELLKCTMDSYKACVTSFVKDNQSIFSQLHDAANYLNIPNLMELTSRTMRDMKKGSTTEEISDRYSTLSIARILSPLGLSLRYSS